MRVLLHERGTRFGRPVQLSLAHMSPGALVATAALVNTGDLALLPDGSIAEPVEVFDREVDAHAHREKLMRDCPGQDFRVILNSDVTG
jgi:hypothetical protein